MIKLLSILIIVLRHYPHFLPHTTVNLFGAWSQFCARTLGIVMCDTPWPQVFLEFRKKTREHVSKPNTWYKKRRAPCPRLLTQPGTGKPVVGSRAGLVAPSLRSKIVQNVVTGETTARPFRACDSTHWLVVKRLTHTSLALCRTLKVPRDRRVL